MEDGQISAGDSIFRLTHEMDKMGCTNNIKIREKQIADYLVLLSMKKDVSLFQIHFSLFIL